MPQRRIPKCRDNAPSIDLVQFSGEDGTSICDAMDIDHAALPDYSTLENRYPSNVFPNVPASIPVGPNPLTGPGPGQQLLEHQLQQLLQEQQLQHEQQQQLQQQPPQQEPVQQPPQQPQVGQQWQEWAQWQLRRHQLRPRYPAAVMRRVAANIASVQVAYNELTGFQKAAAPQPPSTPPPNTVAENPMEILERLKKSLEAIPDNPEERVVGIPPPIPGVLSVHQLFHILRCTPPKIGCVIPNSERQIWYRIMANDYAEHHNLDGGLLQLIEPYPTGEPGYRDSPDCLANGSGSLLWLDDLQIQWCTCHYDSLNTRFVTREGNANGALVVGYRTPWAPICNGCRGQRSVEVMVIDYLTRWFSFPVPMGSHIMDVVEAWAEAEQIQQRDGIVPSTPNGPLPEPEGQAEIVLSAKSKRLSRRVQALLRGDYAVMMDAYGTSTRKPKRRRENEGGREVDENNKRPRVILPMVKRHRLPDGPSSSDPFVDSPSADVSLPAPDPVADTGDVMMLDVWGLDPNAAAAAAPLSQNTAPSVTTAPQQPPQPQQVQQPEQFQWPPPSCQPQQFQQPQDVQQQPQQFQQVHSVNLGGILPKATAAEVHAILAAEGKEDPEEPEEFEVHCVWCKKTRMKPAVPGTKKCQKCIDTHAKIRDLNFERGYCTKSGCQTHMGLPRPTKTFGEPYAYCEQCRQKQQRQRAERRARKAKEAQGGSGGNIGSTA